MCLKVRYLNFYLFDKKQKKQILYITKYVICPQSPSNGTDLFKDGIKDSHRCLKALKNPDF